MSTRTQVFGWLLTNPDEDNQLLFLVDDRIGWVFKIFPGDGGEPYEQSMPLKQYVCNNANACLNDVREYTNYLERTGWTECAGPYTITVTGARNNPKQGTSLAGYWLRAHHPFFRTVTQW